MNFEFDPKKAAANLKKHGVSFTEAMTVFNDLFAQTFPDEFHSDEEDRWITIGLSSRRRLLFVSHLESEGTIRLIGARTVVPFERDAYEELKDRK